MRSIRLRNFRSFRDTGHIELRPLVLLVGTNSSGKSSFLRFFPLLKQTASSTSSSPLLWFGHYVDFRDFQNTVCRFSSSEPISVSFSLRKLAVPMRDRYYYSQFIRSQSAMLDLSFSVDIVNVAQRSMIQSLNLCFEQCICDMIITNKGAISSLIVNGINVHTLFDSKPMPRCSPATLVPLFERNAEARNNFRMAINNVLCSLLETVYHSNTSNETLKKRADRLIFGTREKIIEQLDKLAQGRIKEPKEKAVKEIQALLYARALPVICDRGYSELTSFSRANNYVGPFRVDPQRYYRIQELSVKQIDVHGENMAMWLKSLSDKELSSFSEWVMDTFGFRVCIRQSGGHIEVEIEIGSQRYNIIDMGYGISQVLPIIAQCWADSLKGKNAEASSGIDDGGGSTTRVIAIEQPELHLHPRMQARLADMFVSMIPGVETDRQGELSTCLIIETHSEDMLSRFGEMICEKKLSTSNIVVLLFEKDETTGITEVRQSEFDDNGILRDWPVGFFAP